MSNGNDQVDPRILEAVTTRVIDSYTEMGVLFTALDVSNAVKQTLPGVRHREVSPIVRDLFQRGVMGADYESSNIQVTTPKGDTVGALLYHLDDDDADMYGPSMRSQLAITPVSGAALDSASVDPNITETSLKAGRDGRARLPKKLIENAGVTTDSMILRYYDAQTKLELKKWEPGDASDGDILKYEHPDVLHLPKKCLLVFDTSQPIKATAGQDLVEITGVRAP
jgi:hypothetical protein